MPPATHENNPPTPLDYKTPPIRTEIFHTTPTTIPTHAHNTFNTGSTTLTDALHATMADDNIDSDEPAAQILWNYNIETMHDPAPDDPNSEEISTRKALHPSTHDREKFITAIQAEIHSLLHETKTLVPVTLQPDGTYRENTGNNRTWKIPSTLKCKRKKRGNGEPDKHKARAAARGDVLTRAMLKANATQPPAYSPTIKPLTFSFVLQLAIIHKMTMATMDIKCAYLNAPLPDTSDWIITEIEPHIATICNLKPGQHYRIATALYGLPDSGAVFYRHYCAALTAEGYTISTYDACLFYRITPTETTYITVYVDDTFIFTNSSTTLDNFITSMGKHYTVTLDTVADSFLGLQLTHNNDGSVLLTQPKLLTKLFNEFPPMKSKSTKIPTHPYPPQRLGTQPEPTPCDTYKYLRLLGILMYATKSRPEILAAVSFAGSKSSTPTDRDFQDLYYTVEYLRHTPSTGHLLQSRTPDGPIQFNCEVDASYLIHPDSKSQTGYSIGISDTPGSFHNRSQKQSLVSTSSMHSETRAIYTLVKDLIFLFLICRDLHVPVQLPAIIMEDNSAVITVTTVETAYTKKCKHFLMLINYIKEQVQLGLIRILKIDGNLNRADLHTKVLRDGSFAIKTNNILGLPPPSPRNSTRTPPTKHQPPNPET